MVGLPNLPVELAGTRPDLHRQPPALGEHGVAVLTEAGFTPAEIAALRANGAMVGP